MRYDFLLEPVADDAPCGPDLEAEGDDAFMDYYYDALARFPERFVDTTTGEIFDRKSIDLKSEVEKIGALLARSRDLRLLVVEAQFQILGGQLAGFADCLTAIARLLQERWDDVHPRVGGDPTDRRNTIELLDSRASVVLPLEFAPLLRDKRSQNIVWRDYAVGSGKRPLLGPAPANDASTVIGALKTADNDEAVVSAYQSVKASSDAIKVIVAACRSAGDHAFSPSMSGLNETLTDMMAFFAEVRPDLAAPPEPAEGEGAEGEAGEGEEGATGAAGSPVAPGQVASHAAARAALQAVENYYGRIEPSSPVYFLVRQSRLLIGKPLTEALDLLLPEFAERAKIEFGADQGFVMSMKTIRSLSEGMPTTGADAPVPEMAAETREQATALLAAVETFFRRTEPSSPIPVLLFKAKTYLSRDFSAIINEIIPKESPPAKK